MSVFVTVMLCAASAFAAPRRVLLLHSFDREFPPFSTIADNFRTALGQLSNEPIQFMEVSLAVPGVGSQTDDDAIRNYLIATFIKAPPDLIVPIAGPAARFVQRQRLRLFPTTPVLYAAVDQRWVDTTGMTPQDTAVTVSHDPRLVVDTILEILPRTTTLCVVLGGSLFERSWREELEKVFAPLAPRLQTIWTNDMTFDAIVARTSSLPANSAIFFVMASEDARGAPMSESLVLSTLRNSANAPIFGVHEPQLGVGIVGGPLMSIENVSRNAAAAALRLLGGEPPRMVKTESERPGPPTFDGRQLRRWHIPEDRLPSGSVVVFREPSAWERYRWPIVIGLTILIAEGLLIFALTANQLKRRRAERALRESEERFRLVANTSPVMIWLTDNRRQCTYVNRFWTDFTGRMPEDEFGDGWADGIHQDDREVAFDQWTQAFEARQPFQLEYRLRRYDGEYRWVLDSGVPRFAPDGTFMGYTGSALDVTDQKMAKDALAGLSRSLMTAQDEERARIARDLHDDLGQRAVALAMQLHGIQHSTALGDIERQRLKDMCEQAIALGQNIRTISHRLHSPTLEAVGIVTAVAAFCREFGEQHNVDITFSHDDTIPEDLPNDTSLALFRVLQEALANAAKHSRARHFTVTLRTVLDDIELDVTDHGIGFDPQLALKGRGLGLLSMRERLNLVHGTVAFESKPGVGTKIKAHAPITRTEASMAG